MAAAMIPHEVVAAVEGWAVGVRDRLPAGSHVVLIGATGRNCIEGRLAGLEFRDAIFVAEMGAMRLAAVFRVPTVEGTVAAQVLKTGTGGLWIDGCRISGGAKQASAGSLNGYGGSADGHYEAGTGRTYTSEGRWPTNIVLVHGPGCHCDGAKRVRTSSNGHGSRAGVTLDRRTQAAVYGEYGHMSGVSHVGDDGKETVSAWTCEPGCPVAALDAMSGVLTTNPGTMRKDSVLGGFHGLSSRPAGKTLSQGDSGGASRFYPQLVGADDLVGWLTRLIGGPSV